MESNLEAVSSTARGVSLLKEIQPHAGQSGEAAKCRITLSTIATGCAVPSSRRRGSAHPPELPEGGKNVIGTRLKRPGIDCNVKGAGAIIALRCCILSGRFHDAWE